MGIISKLYEQDPKLALDYVLTEAETKRPSFTKSAFMHVGLLGIDGRTKYGSYKYVTREALEGREYIIEFWDYKVGVFFTDVYHDPRFHNSVPKAQVNMINDLEGYQTGDPPEIGVYNAAMEFPVADTVRYYWNGKCWSEAWHTFWPRETVEKSKQSRSIWPKRYWKKIVE